MTDKSQTSTEAVRRWRAENPERARAANREARRRYRNGSLRKWAEIARQAAAEEAAAARQPKDDR